MSPTLLTCASPEEDRLKMLSLASSQEGRMSLANVTEAESNTTIPRRQFSEIRMAAPSKSKQSLTREKGGWS